MKILGIETTCDETGIAILDIQGQHNPTVRILANEIASQVKIHKAYGGVYPMLAKREHEKNLPIVLKKARTNAHKFYPNLTLDAIAIVIGPGLDPCLWVGVNFAKELAKTLNLPLIPVNHLEGHITTALLQQSSGKSKIQIPRSKTNPTFKIQDTKQMWPAMGLIVSGGHTQLLFMEKIGTYTLIGETRDDAAGECFDKTARILGLPYPGGPALAKQALLEKSKTFNSKLKILLPRPMMYSKDFDFSFSGLKTAVLYDYQSREHRVKQSKEYTAAMAREIQQAIIDVLIAKTMRAAKRYSAKSIILGGGVSANKELRNQVQTRAAAEKLRFFVSSPELSTDNGVMAALAGYIRWKQKEYLTPTQLLSQWDAIGADANLKLQ